MIVKICGITNLEDALMAVEAGADALGFNFYRRSPRYVAPEEAREIAARVPQSVMRVGVFVNGGVPAEVARVADEVGLTAVQLHGDESPAYCRALEGRFVIKAVRAGKDFEPESVLEYGADAILLDAFSDKERGGTGLVVDWTVARRVRELVPRLFLAGGLGPENVAAAVSAVGPYAVDACSRLESVLGRKDPSRMRAFVAAARVKP
ncbi:MAG TPA: phosphoribosylanthranilate isomerase [Pyrinomonadaceae bacterium]|nr:phosphoribosylanthranilate isomerase [Pyrinomonadaceae bacterium]